MKVENSILRNNVNEPLLLRPCPGSAPASFMCGINSGRPSEAPGTQQATEEKHPTNARAASRCAGGNPKEQAPQSARGSGVGEPPEALGLGRSWEGLFMIH